MLEQLKEAVGANPELLTQIVENFPVQDVLKSKGLIIRDSESEKRFLETFENTTIENKIKERIAKVHEAYDEDFEKLFGEKRPQNEKTYNAYKKKIEELKASKIEDPILKDQLLKLQKDLEGKDGFYKSKIEELERNYFSEKLHGLLDVSLANIQLGIPSNITEDAKDKYMQHAKKSLKTDFLNTFQAKKNSDGAIVFYENDQPLTSKTDGHFLTASEIIEEKFGYLIAKEDTGFKGTGSKGKGNAGSQQFKTLNEIVEYVNTVEKLPQGSTVAMNRVRELAIKNALL